MENAVSCDSTKLGGGGLRFATRNPPPPCNPRVAWGFKIRGTNRAPCTQRAQRLRLQGCSGWVFYYFVIFFQLPLLFFVENR